MKERTRGGAIYLKVARKRSRTGLHFTLMSLTHLWWLSLHQSRLQFIKPRKGLSCWLIWPIRRMQTSFALFLIISQRSELLTKQRKTANSHSWQMGVSLSNQRLWLTSGFIPRALREAWLYRLGARPSR